MSSKIMGNVRYCVVIGDDFVSFNGSYKFSYEKAEYILEDRKAQLKKSAEKESKASEKNRLLFLASSARIEICREH